APCSKQSKSDCHADVLTATWWLLAAAAWCTRRHAMPARELLETHSSLMAAPSNWRPRRKPPTAAMRLRFSRAVWSFENPLNELERTSLFRGLSPSQCREISGAGRERTFCQDESIIVEGDAMRSVSLVTAGHAKTVRHSAVGKLMILHVLGPGDVLDGLGHGPGRT